ncbi:MAG: hypothetical protein R6X09_10480 [Bacteroidales bacterium]
MNKRTGFTLILTMMLASCFAAKAQDSLKLTRNGPPASSALLYDEVLVEALVLQIRADSLARIARDLRIQAREAGDESTRKQLTSGMILADKEARRIQELADKQFALAHSMKPAFVKQDPVVNSPIRLSREINGIRVYQYTGNNREIEETSYQPEDSPVREESTAKPVRSLPVAEIPLPASENKEVSKPLKTEAFTISEKSPYSDAHPIPSRLEIIAGLSYRIQLGVFSKTRPNDAFEGITPLAYEVVAGGNMFKYYAGVFYKMNSVTTALEKVRAAGFPDAFLVAFFDGKPIPTEKAREIEFSEFKMKRP